MQSFVLDKDRSTDFDSKVIGGKQPIAKYSEIIKDVKTLHNLPNAGILEVRKMGVWVPTRFGKKNKGPFIQSDRFSFPRYNQFVKYSFKTRD